MLAPVLSFSLFRCLPSCFVQLNSTQLASIAQLDCKGRRRQEREKLGGSLVAPHPSGRVALGGQLASQQAKRRCIQLDRIGEHVRRAHVEPVDFRAARADKLKGKHTLTQQLAKLTNTAAEAEATALQAPPNRAANVKLSDATQRGHELVLGPIQC